MLSWPPAVRAAIRLTAFLPKGISKWRFAFDFPGDWHAFKINLQDVALAIETRLALDVISAGRTVDDCNPDQLAFILAVGQRRAAGCACLIFLQTAPLGSAFRRIRPVSID